MTRAEIDRLFPTVHVKDQVLGNIFGGTFSDSFQKNFSLHQHCHNIIIISKVISSHMGPMYIETPCMTARPLLVNLVWSLKAKSAKENYILINTSI